MKQPLPPNNRDELEAQVTALLLGELTDEQAANVRARIAQDKELAEWHDRLMQTLPLVRETVATPAGQTPAQPAPLKLSEGRRQNLLAHFKTATPIELAWPRRSWMSWPVAIAAAAALGILAALSIPNFVASRTSSSVLTLGIDDRKSQNLRVPSDNELKDLADYVKRVAPASPAPVAKATIVLPPGASGNTTDVYSINGVVEFAELEPPPVVTTNTGGLTAGTGVLPTLSTPQAGRGAARRSLGRSGRDIPSFRFPVDKSKAAETTPSATVETATRALDERSQTTQLASEDPGSIVAGGAPGFGIARVGGAAAFTMAAPPAQPAANGAIGVQGGTAPLAPAVAGSTFSRRDAEGAEKEFVPQAQSVAGTSVGTPTISVRQHEIASTPRPNTLSASAPTTSTAVDMAGTAPVQLAQAAGQDEFKKSEQANRETEALDRLSATDGALPKGAVVAPVPQPEVQTLSNAFSTFSLNVSDVAFKLAAASLENGVMPDVSTVRSEEFINAFDYRDPEPAPGAPIGFAWERAQDPFAQNRDFLRFSVKTAAQGRDAGRPLNLVLLLDKSGSMERADRVEIVRQALTVLAGQLQARDTLSVVTFARTPRLWVDGVPGTQAGEVARKLSDLTPEGGTNLEEAMKLAYATALRHYLSGGENRVVLLTDGAANLGEVDPGAFNPWVESNRKQGIALDCFGIGWDGYNDATLESLSRTGGGRYGFINTPEEAATDFAGQLAGALRVAASDVKVQVEFNPNRVVSYRQIGYANHQLTKEQFRDNAVSAAQIGAAESGNALYTVEVNPAGDGPLCTVRVRYRDPGTSDYHERAWDVPYNGAATPLDKATPAMRLAASAAAFSELLAGSPFASEVTLDKLLSYLNGIPSVYGADTRPQKLEWMMRQAKSISGK